ncbi:MAG: magnesium transporter CorA family protein [Clostridia bacterium]|nr:magnesium transporter CorA family protein [Clostridia bacterium]
MAMPYFFLEVKMINVTYNDKKTNKLIELNAEEIEQCKSFKGKWVHMINPDDKEIEFVSEITSIPEIALKAALDEEERPRIEKEDEYLLVLVDIPVIQDDEDDRISYTTLPMGIIVTENILVTVCLKDSAVTRDFIYGRVKNVFINNPTRFTFQLLFTIATKFLHYLRQIDKTSQKVQTELHKSMKNKELIQLLDIENTLVYFSTSIRTNNVVIDKLSRSNFLPKVEEDQDLIEDVAIESLQALDMCNTYKDILSSTMDAFASVISNNLNIVMKILTSITVIISVPTLIASLFGMNLGGIPGGNFKFGFLIVTLVSLLMAVGLGLVLYRKKMM